MHYHLRYGQSREFLSLGTSKFHCKCRVPVITIIALYADKCLCIWPQLAKRKKLWSLPTFCLCPDGKVIPCYSEFMPHSKPNRSQWDLQFRHTLLGCCIIIIVACSNMLVLARVSKWILSVVRIKLPYTCTREDHNSEYVMIQNNAYSLSLRLCYCYFYIIVIVVIPLSIIVSRAVALLLMLTHRHRHRHQHPIIIVFSIISYYKLTKQDSTWQKRCRNGLVLYTTDCVCNDRLLCRCHLGLGRNKLCQTRLCTVMGHRFVQRIQGILNHNGDAYRHGRRWTVT